MRQADFFTVFLSSCKWVFVLLSTKIITGAVQAYFEGKPGSRLRRLYPVPP